MNKLPPSIPTNLHPDDIIGGYQDLIKRHFIATYRPFNGDFDKAARKFSHEEREIVGRIHKELRENGFYPTGFNQYGDVRWGYRVTYDAHKEQEEAKFKAACNLEAAESLLKAYIPHLRTKAEREVEPSASF